MKQVSHPKVFFVDATGDNRFDDQVAVGISELAATEQCRGPWQKQWSHEARTARGGMCEYKSSSFL